MNHLIRTLALMLALLPFAACHELGHMDDPGTVGATTGDLVGEVQFVDTGVRQIEVRTDAGRSWNVRYDNQTRVLYRQRSYAISNLEPGDYVALRTRQDRDGQLYTDTVTVRDSAQDRGYTGATNTVRGTVTINTPQYNSFAMDTAKGNYVFVYDAQTRVRFRNSNYFIKDILVGDQIAIRVRENAAGNFPVADVITVVRKRDGSAAASRLDSFEGRVEFVDARRGQFEVRDNSNRLVVVNLLYNPAKNVADRFNRLRNGDYVRIEGRFINQDRFELENFLQ